MDSIVLKTRVVWVEEGVHSWYEVQYQSNIRIVGWDPWIIVEGRYTSKRSAELVAKRLLEQGSYSSKKVVSEFSNAHDS